MVYLVSTNQELLKSDLYQALSIEKSLELLSDCKVLQVDTETEGLDPYLHRLLTVQFGNDSLGFQMVIDATTIDIVAYKNILEDKFLILQNAKFDLQFFFTLGIVPRKIWDTMIVEQLLHLGYPKGVISYSLQAIASRRLSTYIDKEIRGQINSRGLDTEVIRYAANDVKYLEKIAKSQKEECIKKKCLKGAILENEFTPCNAYLEWCGIKLDKDKWSNKMKEDHRNLCEKKRLLDSYILSLDDMEEFITIPIIGDLFEEVSFDPYCNINWSSSREVVALCKKLGFDTIVTDKETGKEKDSVLEKHLKSQKGIDDVFLKLYFDYKEYEKVVSSFGNAHLNSIHPITQRLHTNYNQLGAATGRMSSGGGKNKVLSEYYRLPLGSCIYPNMQQLPHDPVTRSCFVAEEGNLFCSVDYDGMEARLGAIIYKEKAFIDEFLYGSGDMHSVWAKHAFSEELKDVSTKDIKKLYPDLRQKAKAYGFNCRSLI